MSQILENEAISQLLNNISNDEKNNIKNKFVKSKIKSEKNCCIAAVRYNTIGRAYKNILNNIPVYLVTEKENDNNKPSAYSRCSKTSYQKNNLCHIHADNNKDLKIFEKDILPQDSNDKTRWLANINDDFFENMGKRGAKKKNCENNYTFSESNNPILLILNHKNPKLITHLSIYASQLLKGNYQVLNNNDIDQKKSKVDKSNNNIPNLNDIISIISSIDDKNIDNFQEIGSIFNKLSEKNNLLKNKSVNDKLINDEFVNNKLINDEFVNNKVSNDELDDSSYEEVLSINQNVEDEDSEDGISCIPIYTLKKRMLWFDQESNTVYEPEGEDSGAEMGVLKEISIDFHTIYYNDKYYSVLKELNDNKYGKIFCCVLTDRLFNRKLHHIGTKKKLKNNEYQLNFFNEI